MVKLKKKYKSIKTIKDVKSLAARLAPLQRHAITEGTKNAIKILNEYLNFNLVNIKSNTVCWDWNIPKQWKHIESEIKFNGKKIFSGSEHVMAVQPYSDSFEGKLKKEEFLKHIVTNKFRPKAYAYNCKLAYRYPFEKDWLISIPYEKVKLLKKGQYDI